MSKPGNGCSPDDNLATLNVPPGRRYLPGDQSHFVLTDIWGNPPSESLGMFFPENLVPFDSASLAFNIAFDALYDNGADDINYGDLLNDMKKNT